MAGRRRAGKAVIAQAGEEGHREGLSGWLVEWPVTDFLANVYFILAQHADSEQLAKLEEQLSEPDPTDGETVEDVGGIIDDFIAKQRARGVDITLPPEEPDES